MQTLSENLRSWRLGRKFSQRQAADALKINKRTYENWEYGIRSPIGIGRAAVERFLETANKRGITMKKSSIKTKAKAKAGKVIGRSTKGAKLASASGKMPKGYSKTKARAVPKGYIKGASKKSGSSRASAN